MKRGRYIGTDQGDRPPDAGLFASGVDLLRGEEAARQIGGRGHAARLRRLRGLHLPAVTAISPAEVDIMLQNLTKC